LAHTHLAPTAKSRLHNGRKVPRTSQARTILVVDDNEVAAEALGRLLELRGHTVGLAFDGSSAIRSVRESPPEVIILDIGLPDIDGYEVAHILQQEKQFSSILIALTGYGQAQDKERARKAGFQAHLIKPVGIAEIEEAFRHLPHASKR
jgi:CheY-like chemotaxis protein